MGWSWWALGNRPMVFPFVFLLAGVGLGPAPAGWGWPLAAASIACGVFGLWWAPRIGSTLGLLSSCLTMGLALSTLAWVAPIGFSGVRIVEGEVEEVSTRGDVGGLRLAATQLGEGSARLRVALVSEGIGDLLPGQRVAVETALRPMRQATNPGQWSRTQWALRRGQGAQGRFDENRLAVLTAAPAWRRWISQSHRTLKERVLSHAPDRESAGLFLTLAAGERGELGADLEDVFSRSGLAHVLSVSGLHVAVLALSAFALLRWLLSRHMVRSVRRRDPRLWAAPFALPIMWAYVIYTELQAPAVRSAVMCSLLLLSHGFRRRSDSLNALAAAGFFMTLVDPAAPFDLSVQLSFLAVLGLILLTPQVRVAIPLQPPSPQRDSGWRLTVARWREAAVQTLAASTAVTLVTMPLILGAFQRASLAGLASNVVTLPISGLLTVLAASGAGLHAMAPEIASPVVWVGLQVSRAFVAIAHGFAMIPGGSVELPSAPWHIVGPYWAGLAALVFLRGRRRWLALLTPIAAVAHVVGPSVLPSSTVDVTFLSVGHGDAIVISAQGHHALIDGGGVPNGSDTGRRIVIPFLRQQRISRLDLAVLSHPHPDHALGLISTLEEVPAQALWLPAEVGSGELIDGLIDSAGEARIEEVDASEPPRRLGEATLEVLSPHQPRAEGDLENDRSLVLKLRHGRVTFLFPGDIQQTSEADLETGPITVMKAPHHGSDTSSTQQFVKRARPKYVVFCVGRDNRFGFPRRDVVERYRAIGSECFRTDIDGAVTFRSDGDDVAVSSFAPHASEETN